MLLVLVDYPRVQISIPRLQNSQQPPNLRARREPTLCCAAPFWGPPAAGPSRTTQPWHRIGARV